jgi:hypothetical protein
MPANTTRLASMAVAALLAGCGGGDYDSGPHGPALERAAGFYNGTTSSNRHLSVIVIETGRYYAVYGPINSPTSSVIEGVLIGDGTAGGSTFSSNSLHDINFTAQATSLGAMTATFLLQSYFDANIAYNSGGTGSFTSDYSFRYEDRPSLASVAGSYVGQLASVTSVDNATFTISSSGALSVSVATGGCSAGGTVSLHPFGNVYDIAITYGPGCAASGQTLTGHAKFDSTLGSLTAVTSSPDFNSVVMVVGTKP